MTTILTAVEEFEKAEKILRVSRERLTEVESKIPALESEIEDLLYQNEIKGHQSKAIEKMRKELDDLQKEKENLLRTIEAFDKRLPELRRRAGLEEVTGKGIAEYNNSREEYIAAINDRPVHALDSMINNIGFLDEYYNRICNVQDKFLLSGKRLSEYMLKEKVESIAGITIETLKEDRQLDKQNINDTVDKLSDLSEKVENLYIELAAIVETRAFKDEYKIKDFPLPHVNEMCSCGLHRREFDPSTDAAWHIWEQRRDTGNPGTPQWKLIYNGGGFKSKPDFPCEKLLYSRKAETAAVDVSTVIK